jgi:predicted ABC-type ATPase
MFAGPNGSGKTSLVRKFSRDFSPGGLFRLHQYINADDLHRDLLSGSGVLVAPAGGVGTAEQLRSALIAGGRLRANHPFLQAMEVVSSRLLAPAEVVDAYAAAAVADHLRAELLAAGQSFSFETVMSHRSKTDFFARARAAGYRTYLYFIATETAHLNIRRVKHRTTLGGHDVPEEKIVERYQRCLELVPEALAHAHRAFLFDNSGDDPVLLAEMTPESTWKLEVSPDSLPAWFKTWVAPHYPGLLP